MRGISKTAWADIAKMRARLDGAPPLRIVAWLLPATEPTVYCRACVDATLAQQDRWQGIPADVTWPVPCALCGRGAP